MKILRYIRNTSIMALVLLVSAACTDLLDTPLENQQIAEETDYTQSENMVQLIYGAYAELYSFGWEIHPLIGVRGDDVNAAGDQVPLQETDMLRYDRNAWIYSTVWVGLYSDLINWQGAIEEIQQYQEAGANATAAQQYIAEIKVLQGFKLLHLARMWGRILIPRSSQPSDLFNVELSSFEEVMQHISNLMDEAIPSLPNVRPNQRTDITGGVTRHTALAVKAMANLELKNWPAVADATGQIISSGLFSLSDDYYQLFNIPGKLDDEKLFEFQYSDYGTATGTVNSFNYAVYGPPAAGWTPARAGAGAGWGFWEPTTKYIKFMLDRNERLRLPVTVLFTPAGIAEIQSDPDYANLPDWVTNRTRDNDVFHNHPRYLFLSGKHYLPTVQLTEGRVAYGTNNNFTVIRYSEILLMHAEALVSGASSAAMSADEAVNAVRNRAGLGNLSGVTIDQVLDEKFAEFGMEWGIRFYDVVRHERTSELNYGGRNFDMATHRFLPYPLEQQNIIPQLRGE